MHAVEICLDNVTGVVCPNVEICMNLTVVITFRSPAYAIEPFLINTAKTRTSPDCRLHIDPYLFFTPIYTNTLRAFLNHGLEPSLRLSSNPYLVGDTLEIVLKGNPTTGYMWEVASVDTTVLSQVCEPEFRPKSDARGSGGKIIMRFKAVSVGHTLLKLIYHRPFEKNKPPIRVFSVTVIVKR